jgi:chemotaxis signal transduction protein
MDTATSNQCLSETNADKEGKYLTFILGPEEYGLEILKVREIIGYMDITAVPQMPFHVKGVINLRGQVIPVIDLRAKFGMETADITEQTCIISSGNQSWFKNIQYWYCGRPRARSVGYPSQGY